MHLGTGLTCCELSHSRILMFTCGLHPLHFIQHYSVTTAKIYLVITSYKAWFKCFTFIIHLILSINQEIGTASVLWVRKQSTDPFIDENTKIQLLEIDIKRGLREVKARA